MMLSLDNGVTSCKRCDAVFTGMEYLYEDLKENVNEYLARWIQNIYDLLAFNGRIYDFRKKYEKISQDGSVFDKAFRTQSEKI